MYVFFVHLLVFLDVAQKGLYHRVCLHFIVLAWCIFTFNCDIETVIASNLTKEGFPTFLPIFKNFKYSGIFKKRTPLVRKILSAF